MKRLLTLLLVCAFAAVPAISAEKKEAEGKADASVAKTSLQKVEEQSAAVKENNAAEKEQAAAAPKDCFLGKLMLYAPNRILDLMDIFTLDIKSGAMAGIGFHLTRACGLDFEVGPSLVMFKDYNRQYGFGTESGYQAQFLFLYAEDMNVANPIGSVKDYWQYGSNFPTPAEQVYNWKSGARDYWAIDVTAECLLGVKAALHPVEIVDFLTGLVLYDLKGDDLVVRPMIF